MSYPGRGCICINGRFFEPAEAKVSALDAGFLLGDGIFESLRTFEGVPYLLDRHLARLFVAAEAFEITRMPTRETVIEQVYRTLQRSGLVDAYVRITVTRGCDAIGLAPPVGPPTIVIAALPASARRDIPDQIDTTLLYTDIASNPTAKSTSWQHAVIARRRVAQCGADEGIYVSSDGEVLEGVTSNIFAVDDCRLLTPPTSGILPGVTRARLLELARDADISIRETGLAVDTLLNAEEVFLTNAVQGLRSVRAIDGIAVGSSGAHEMFAALLHLYEADRGAMVGATR